MLKRNVLRKKTDFDSIYNRGKSVGDRYVVLFYKPNGLAYNRTGFLASKKVGNSVKRNRARRLMKESYRHLLAESKTEVLSTLNISDDAYHAYTYGMYLVANETKGTAYSTFKNYPITVAAKTGTAQGGNTNASDNGAFVCYAPADNPRIAIAIYGEKAGHGSTLTTIARDILDVYFEVGEVSDVTSLENKLS